MNRQQKRKLRTRNLLKQTATDLLIANGYDALTVQQITDTADVARGTFYVHFGDKESIVWEVAADVLTELHSIVLAFGEIDSQEKQYQKWFALFRGIEGHRPLLGTLLGPQGDVVLVGRFQQFLSAAMADGLQDNVVPFLVGLPRDFAASFLAGGMAQVIMWWFAQDEVTVSAETVTNQFCKIIMPDYTS